MLEPWTLSGLLRMRTRHLGKLHLLMRSKAAEQISQCTLSWDVSRAKNKRPRVCLCDSQTNSLCHVISDSFRFIKHFTWTCRLMISFSTVWAEKSARSCRHPLLLFYVSWHQTDWYLQTAGYQTWAAQPLETDRTEQNPMHPGQQTNTHFAVFFKLFLSDVTVRIIKG